MLRFANATEEASRSVHWPRFLVSPNSASSKLFKEGGSRYGENESSTVLRILDWRVPGDGMWMRVIVDAISEDEVRDTPLKSHIISTTLAQLIEAIDIVGWEEGAEEVRPAELLENLETALDILKDKLGYIDDVMD